MNLDHVGDFLICAALVMLVINHGRMGDRLTALENAEIAKIKDICVHREEMNDEDN